MGRLRYTQYLLAFFTPKAYNSQRDGISYITYGKRGNEVVISEFKRAENCKSSWQKRS